MTPNATTLTPTMAQRFETLLSTWKVRQRVFRGFGLAIAVVSILAILITYIVLTDRPLISEGGRNFYWLVTLDITLLSALTVAVGWRVWRVWANRKQKLAGAQLHIQLMKIFAALAAVPAILVAIFAVVFIHLGVQAWFGEQIKSAVGQSHEIAQAYLQEHQQSIRADVLAMASDLNRASLRANNDKKFLDEFFRTQAYLRNLSEAVLINSSGDILTRAGMSLSLEFLPPNFQKMLKKADNDEVVLFMGENEDRVRALVKLDNYIDTYLFVGRFVDEKVLSSVVSTNKAVNAYEALQAKQSQLKASMTIIFTLVALMLLLVAIWTSLTLAQRIVDPVSNLILAAERVRSGDLNARVEEHDTNTEVGTLARAFNRMTEQLRNQRKDLINANRQLDERRRFTETVLAGVNAGILGMDETGTIQVANASALKLLGREAIDLVGKKLSVICPEMETVRRVLRSKPGRSVEIPIDVITGIQTEAESHWVVRMTAEGSEDELRGYVATFDDLSPLMDAQRKAAWADVARRVAHEIKNPLTPIQLSAERLKKRYSKQIVEDRETFEACTDTIVRQVDDIRKMIDEFSAFARMPTSTKQTENLTTLCQQVMVLFQQGHTASKFTFQQPDKPIYLSVDRQQISQALTNLVKNAFEATQETGDANGSHVTLALGETADNITFTVSDNGPGWPPELLPRLTDPYVTTKVNGSGLGLAIVAKIAEDHHGKLEFLNNTPRGAIVRLSLPKGETAHG